VSRRQHTDWADGRHPLDRLVAAAEARGYEYIIVSDHSKSTAIANGLDVDALRAQRRVFRGLQPRLKIRILARSECDILADGSLDVDEGTLASVDYVVASVHSHFGQSEAEMTARIVKAVSHPRVTILGHATGRLLLRREGYKVDIEAVLRAAAEQRRVALEDVVRELEASDGAAH